MHLRALLAALEALRAGGCAGKGGRGAQVPPLLHDISCVRYAPSAAARGEADTSVLYAAAVVMLCA